MYVVIKTKKAGWCIQHSTTFAIVTSGLTQMQAVGICDKLNCVNR